MPIILFVCTANQFRSPLAAAAFQKEIDDKHPLGIWIIQSAGSWVKQTASAHPLAIEYANQIGVDLRHHKSQEVTRNMLRQASLIIVMSQGQKEAFQYEFSECKKRIYSLNELVGDASYGIADPAESGFADAEPIWMEIQKKVDLSFPRIIQLAVENNAKTKTK